MKIVHTRDTMSAIYLDALHIRNQVFMNEQGVPKDIEIDQHEAACVHFVLYKEDQALATCRLLPLEENTVKLQRMAVLKGSRGKELGRALLEEVERFAHEQGITGITLGAQSTAVPFYQSLGYTKHGEEFLDANIPHYKMDKQL